MQALAIGITKHNTHGWYSTDMLQVYMVCCNIINTNKKTKQSIFLDS